MPLRQKTDVELAPELEAIATAAAERLRAWANGDEPRAAQLQESVGEAANRAIGAGVSLGAIADAERIGQARAREELGREVLRGVGRAARRKREAEHEYEQAVSRGARLSLATPRRGDGGTRGARHGPRDHRAHIDSLGQWCRSIHDGGWHRRRPRSAMSGRVAACWGGGRTNPRHRSRHVIVESSQKGPLRSPRSAKRRADLPAPGG